VGQGSRRSDRGFPYGEYDDVHDAVLGPLRSAAAASRIPTDEEETNGNPTGAGLVALAIQRAENPRGDAKSIITTRMARSTGSLPKSTLFTSSDLE
jgi:hypothetical protein